MPKCSNDGCANDAETTRDGERLCAECAADYDDCVRATDAHATYYGYFHCPDDYGFGRDGYV